MFSAGVSKRLDLVVGEVGRIVPLPALILQFDDPPIWSSYQKVVDRLNAPAGVGLILLRGQNPPRVG